MAPKGPQALPTADPHPANNPAGFDAALEQARRTDTEEHAEQLAEQLPPAEPAPVISPSYRRSAERVAQGLLNLIALVVGLVDGEFGEALRDSTAEAIPDLADLLCGWLGGRWGKLLGLFALVAVFTRKALERKIARMAKLATLPEPRPESGSSETRTLPIGIAGGVKT